jgi:hypothetical protein
MINESTVITILKITSFCVFTIVAIEAAKGWKKLKGYKMILLVLENRKFIDGELEEAA